MLLKELIKQIDLFIKEDPRNADIDVIVATEDDGFKHNQPPGSYAELTTYDYILAPSIRAQKKVFVICGGKPIMYARPYWWGNNGNED